MRTTWNFLAAGFLAIIARPAVAATSVQLAYDAPAECPDKGNFWRELWLRSAKLGEWARSGQALTIDARFAPSSPKYTGYLRIYDRRGVLVERGVDGATCAEVTSAIALIAAIALDTPAARPSTAVSAKSRTTLSLGLLGGAHAAISDHITPTLGLSLTIRDSNTVSSSELRFSAVFGSGDRIEAKGSTGDTVGAARFSWYALRTTGCPIEGQVASITFGPCALLEIGALEGTGLDAVRSRSRTGFWLAPGLAFNGSLQLKALSFRLAAGAVRPLVRDRFLFAPNTEIFRPRTIGPVAELELAWSFD